MGLKSQKQTNYVVAVVKTSQVVERANFFDKKTRGHGIFQLKTALENSMSLHSRGREWPG